MCALRYQLVYQIGSGGGAVFAHEPRAVNLHRAVADVQVAGNLLAGGAGHDVLRHLALAHRERRADQ